MKFKRSVDNYSIGSFQREQVCKRTKELNLKSRESFCEAQREKKEKGRYVQNKVSRWKNLSIEKIDNFQGNFSCRKCAVKIS